jgi:hypothetical protein
VIFYRKPALRFVARHGPSRAMAAVAEAVPIPLAANDIRTRPHTSGNDPHVALASPYRALSGDQHVLAEMRLARHIVVVAIDRFDFRAEGRHLARTAHGRNHLLHHEIAVATRIVLSPLDRLHIIAEVIGVLGEIGQIDIRKIDKVLPHIFSGQVDKVNAHAVADPPRPAVQHEPNGLRLVEADLDKVISRSQRAEMVRVVSAVELRMFRQDRVVSSLKFAAPYFSVALGNVVPRAAIARAAVIRTSVRHAGFDCRPDVLQIVREIARVEASSAPPSFRNRYRRRPQPG